MTLIIIINVNNESIKYEIKLNVIISFHSY